LHKRTHQIQVILISMINFSTIMGLLLLCRMQRTKHRYVLHPPPAVIPRGNQTSGVSSFHDHLYHGCRHACPLTAAALIICRDRWVSAGEFSDWVDERLAEGRVCGCLLVGESMANSYVDGGIREQVR
jgi:hypothetical protein